MEDYLLGIIGLLFLYSVVHYIIISFSKTWTQRTDYEKVVTVTGLFVITLIFMEAMFFDS